MNSTKNPYEHARRECSRVRIIPIPFKKGIRPGSEMKKFLKKLGVDQTDILRVSTILTFQPCLIELRITFIDRKVFKKAWKVLKAYDKKGCIKVKWRENSFFHGDATLPSRVDIETL